MLGVWHTSRPYTPVPKSSVQLPQYCELHTFFFVFLQRREIELDLAANSLGSIGVEVIAILLITESLSLLLTMKQKQTEVGLYLDLATGDGDKKKFGGVFQQL